MDNGYQTLTVPGNLLEDIDEKQLKSKKTFAKESPYGLRNTKTQGMKRPDSAMLRYKSVTPGPLVASERSGSRLSQKNLVILNRKRASRQQDVFTQSRRPAAVATSTVREGVYGN